MDEDLGDADDHIGRCDIPLNTLARTVGLSVAYPLVNASDEKTGELIIQCTSFMDATQPLPRPPYHAPEANVVTFDDGMGWAI